MIVYDATTEDPVRGPWVYLGSERYAQRVLELPQALSDEELLAYAMRRLGELFPAEPETLAVDAIRLGEGACLVVAARREELEALRSRHGRARIAFAVEGPWKAGRVSRLILLPGFFERVDFGGDGSLSIARGEREAGDLSRLPLPPEAARGEPWELVASGAELAALRAAPPEGAILVDLDARPGRGEGAFSSKRAERRKAALPFMVLGALAAVAFILLAVLGSRLEAQAADLAERRRAFAAALTEISSLREGLAAPQALESEKPDALDALAALADSAVDGLVATRISVEGGAVVMEARAQDALAALEAARAQTVVEELALRGVAPDPKAGERFTLSGRLHDGE